MPAAARIRPVPYKRTGRSTDRADQRSPGCTQTRGADGDLALTLRADAVQARHDRCEPAVHVGPVIAVADGLVQCR